MPAHAAKPTLKARKAAIGCIMLDLFEGEEEKISY
jgi:hypothetical protein